MKTTVADFDRFKHTCLRLQQEWGLIDYTLYFTHGTPSDALATCNVDEEGCVARLSYTKKVLMEDAPPIEVIAKHEMLHLLISRVQYVGSCRWAADDELDNECERLVVKLEKIL